MYHNPSSTLSSSMALPPRGLDDVHLTPSSSSMTNHPSPRIISHSSQTASTTTLAKAWREIQGCGDWQHLIKPLDPLLRREITRYGEFAAACYKAFDFDQRSRRYMNCKYGKRSMFESVGMGATGYEITKYIYATPDIAIPSASTRRSRWIGYVAVASDAEVGRLGRRDILVAFRGTVTGTEWVANLMSSLSPARFDPNDPQPDVMVESGFLSLYTGGDSTCSRFGQGSCREQLLREVSRLIDRYGDEEEEELSVTMVGHSMGSSLALLLGYDIAELELNSTSRSSSNRESSSTTIPLTVFKFAGPRVGNAAFKRRCEELGIKVLRVANVNDPVTKLPGVVMNEHLGSLMGKYEMPWSCSCYAHVGVELALDFFSMHNPAWVHDIQAYIQVLEATTTAAHEQIETSTSDQRCLLLRNALSFLGFSS